MRIVVLVVLALMASFVTTGCGDDPDELETRIGKIADTLERACTAKLANNRKAVIKARKDYAKQALSYNGFWGAADEYDRASFPRSFESFDREVQFICPGSFPTPVLPPPSRKND
ncbi:MAG: hypothetical protein WD846_02200 [Patescibacteria group bacterium]